ncbi:MAG: Hsp20/alpha crystallin family protein [Calditrichaeota bacterium]|nr:Hsp20/alpha crystallin family protein [candidate division KSB1 bacterium]MCZ6820344.1 Hsp20/alpha crystallin family protein [Calditrichota bacterium]
MLVKYSPFGSLLKRDFFLDDFFSPSLPAVRDDFEPRVDVQENEKEYVISAELPGLNKDDFSVKLEDNLLTLSGEKKFEKEEKDEASYKVERRYGAFKRSFRLTDAVDSKKISAEYKNGVLEVKIPKAEKAKAKEIAVNIK